MGRITIALAKGRLFQKSMDVFRKVGITAPDLEENSRMLVIPGEIAASAEKYGRARSETAVPLLRSHKN